MSRMLAREWQHARAWDGESGRASAHVAHRRRKQPIGTQQLGILECPIDVLGNVVSRQSILDSVWGFDSFCGLRAVDTNVGCLRAKLGASVIRAKPGLGYCCPADETKDAHYES